MRYLSLLVLMLLAGCGGLPKNVVVLLADEGGGTGTIVVANAGGSTTANQPLTAVDMGERTRPLQAPVAVEEKEVREAFAAALAAVPRQAQHFILQFGADSADITPAAEAELARVITAIRGVEAPDIGISGHADRTGTDALNERLSLRRADAVRGRLAAAGVAPDSIRIKWHGANNPAVPDRPGVPEPRNRRVEVIIR
jgi:outer membrane protein OmpA-like peptidoglycan-associated protein